MNVDGDGARSLTVLGQRRGLNEPGITKARRWGGVNTRLHGAAAGALARTRFLDGRRAAEPAARGEQPLHHAVVLAVPAAAGGKTGLGVGRKERRDQHPAEQGEERDCDGAPHGNRRIEDETRGRSAAAVTKAASQRVGAIPPTRSRGEARRWQVGVRALPRLKIETRGTRRVSGRARKQEARG